MILKRFYDDKLAQASYLVGCAATGTALVVDPNRDIEVYLEEAGREGLRITHVTETHVHADFVSGSRELASRTGAALYLSAEGGTDWRYGYAEADGATLLRDGDRFMVGNVRVEVWHTPGHTPEHLGFLVTDTAGADRPMGIFTGDFVFVGDVGRPDLLERAARVAGTTESSARQLFHSLARFRELPDFLQIWPGHGAGSACGKALGAVPTSTVGYEKLFNPALQETDEDRFAEWILSGQPEPPKYFAEMKRINRDGPRLLNGLPHPPRLDEARLPELLESGAVVVDTRDADAFAAGHVPGTLSIPQGRKFTTWAGWLLPYDRDVYLIAAEGGALDEAVRDLALIGLDRVAGFFGTEAVSAWKAEGRPLQATPAVDVRGLAERMRSGDVQVVDVRGQGEWEAGHIPGVPNVPLGYLAERLEELDRDRPVAVHCQGGRRSAIAASLLQAHGFPDVVDVRGGFGAWAGAGEPVERGEATSD